MGRKTASTTAAAAREQFEPLVLGVKQVLRAGLPVRPTTAPDVLLDLDGVIARSVKPEDPLARVDALDRLLRGELERLGLQDRRESALLLFGAVRGGGSLTERRRLASNAAHLSFDHLRKNVEPKIIEQLAWQLHQDALQYVNRQRGFEPFDASGTTPVITEEHLLPDEAEREALLSGVWSEVYGLRGELIRREGARDDPERVQAFEDAAAGALWRLARLLTKLDAYLERYGSEIMAGSASYNAESLIRLAGWTGDVTTEQARELRYRLARVGEWDPRGFAVRPAPEN